MTYRKYKDVLGLVDKKAQGFYLPYWMYEASKKCLFQYAIIRDKPKAVPARKSISDVLLVGCGVHIGAEGWARGKSDEVCLEEIRQEIRELAAGTRSDKMLMSLVKEAVRLYRVSVSLVSEYKSMRVIPEQPVRQSYDGIILGCRTDAVAVVDEKKRVADIWDYKGSKSESSVKSLQLRFNATAIELAGWTVRKAFFVLPSLGKIKAVKFTQNLKKRLLANIIIDVQKANAGDCPASPSVWTCKYCNFALSCPHSVVVTDFGDLSEGLVSF